MKALVTGSAGFLGRHFVKALQLRGAEVRRVDIADAAPWDARDFYRFGTTRYDLAIHCAAVVGGRQKIEGAPMDLAVDLCLDAEFFQWALRTEVGRAVYISSSAAYPVCLQNGFVRLSRRANGEGPEPLQEDDVHLERDVIGCPDALYGWSKLMGEILSGHTRAAGVPVTVVRPFSGYGTDQDPTYPFRAFLERARRREDPFTIWGDGEQVRDFIHVSDVVAGTLALVEAGVDGPVNLGTGRPTSFNELARMMTRAAGYAPEFRHEADKPVGVRYRVADPTRLLQRYEPRVRLEDVIAAALDDPSQVAV